MTNKCRCIYVKYDQVQYKKAYAYWISGNHLRLLVCVCFKKTERRNKLEFNEFKSWLTTGYNLMSHLGVTAIIYGCCIYLTAH